MKRRHGMELEQTLWWPLVNCSVQQPSSRMLFRLSIRILGDWEITVEWKSRSAAHGPSIILV